MSEPKTKSWFAAVFESASGRAAVLFILALIGLPFLMHFTISVERDVTRYATFEFEPAARQALESCDAAQAVEICTGAIRTALNRSDFFGLAYLLRAKGRALSGDQAGALADLRRATRCWTRDYYYPTPEQRQELAAFGVELTRNFAKTGDPARACTAISAAGVGSGAPVDFLHDQAATLDAETRAAVWPETPVLTLEDFAGDDAPNLVMGANQQKRELVGTSHSDIGADGASAAIELGASGQDGRSSCYLPVHVPLSEKAFALRVRMQGPEGTQVAIGYWFDKSRQSVLTWDKSCTDAGDGWRLFDIRRDFYRQRVAYAKEQGYDPAGAVIDQIGFDPPQGPPCKILVDSVELYIPN